MSVTRTHFDAMAGVPTPLLRDVPPVKIDVLRHRAHEITLDWFAVADRIGQHVDLDATAYANGAMVRRRGVPSATNLLCLALLYGPGNMPLRLIVERSATLGIAQVSEPALLRRLMNAAPWLEFLADTLIAERLEELAEADCKPGLPTHRNADWTLSQTFHERSGRQVGAAKRFFTDFAPWSDDTFSDSQIHWLMSTRWLFVKATVTGGLGAGSGMAAKPMSALDRSRLLAHLVNAIASPRD